MLFYAVFASKRVFTVDADALAYHILDVSDKASQISAFVFEGREAVSLSEMGLASGVSAEGTCSLDGFLIDEFKFGH